MMSEIQKCSSIAQNNVSYVEAEEGFVETFREVFGESESSFHNASLNNIVEKVEINEAIKEIQEKIKNKEQRLERMFTFDDPTQIILLLSGFSIALGVLALHLLHYLDFSENTELLIWLTSMGILPLYFFCSLPKRLKKEKTLSNDISHLYREMLQIKLQGTIIGDPYLSENWNVVQIQQNSKIVEYVVRIVADKNGNKHFETKELK